MINILALMLQFVLLLMFAMFWYKLLDWSPEESVCMSVLCIMTLVLAGGFFGQALAAVGLIYVFSFLGLLLFLGGKRVSFAIGRSNSRKAFFSPGILLLAAVFLYGVIMFRGLVICNWDEMHQWGKAVTFMLHNNALPRGGSFDGDGSLLSSTTMFHYFWCKLPKVLSGSITEGNMYVSNLVLWFSAVILPLGGMKWRSWRTCGTYAAVVFLAMNVLFVQPYYNIYCDQPLAMWTGALITWGVFCGSGRYRPAFIVPALVQIGLMKSMMGPLFAVIAALALLIRFVVLRKEAPDPGEPPRLFSLKRAAAVLAVFFAAAAVWLTAGDNSIWKRLTGIFHVDRERLVLTLKSGLAKWFRPVNMDASFPRITYFLFLVLTVVICYLYVKNDILGKQKKQYVVLMRLYAAGYFAFFALMIFVYLTVFTYEESIGTVSFHRYLSDYIMLGFLPLLYPAAADSARRDRLNSILLVFLVAASLCATNNFVRKATPLKVTETRQYKERLRFEDYREAALSLMDSDQKIYMINQNSDGYFTVAADYVFEHLLDRVGMCYYFTEEKTSINGLSRADIRSLPEILLRGYGYLWIYKTDDYFSENAFDVLKIREPVNGDFYKVTSQDGRLKLRYLGNLTSGR